MDTVNLSLSRSTPPLGEQPFSLDPAAAGLALRPRTPTEIELIAKPRDHFEPRLAKPRRIPRHLVYDEFIHQHRCTVASHKSETRRTFLQFFNTVVSPHLVTEEAAFQLLSSRVCNLFLEENYPIDLNIHRNLEGNAVTRYAKHYTLRKPHIDLQQGLTLYEMAPDDRSKDVILAFPGTAGFSRRDGLSVKNLPTGRLADMDRTGVGRRAFEANRAIITERIKEIVDGGQNVTLLGFSLGGAYAARSLAALPAEYQARCQLRSFFAPGLDAETAARIVPGNDNVESVYHAYDIVCAAGDSHLPGKSVRITDMILCGRNKQTPHSIPQLAVRELLGQPAQFTISDQPRMRNPLVEGMRKTLSRFVEGWVTP